MGRRMMRAAGAGLMEAGNQAQLYQQNAREDRKLSLEKQRQENLLKISEGRQGLMTERLAFDKSTAATNIAEKREDKFYNRAGAMVSSVYGKDGMSAQELETFNNMVKFDGEPKLALQKMIEAGLYTPETAPDIAKLEKLYKGLEGAYNTTIGRAEDAPEFNLQQVLSQYPATYTELNPVAAEEGGEEVVPEEEEQGWMSRAWDSFTGSGESSEGGKTSFVEGQPRQLGREFGLMSAEGLGAAGREIYGGGEFDPYFKGINAVVEGYQEHIGGPFERLMLGDKRYLDSNAGPVSGEELQPEVPQASYRPRK